jgi:hypothetical protein
MRMAGRMVLRGGVAAALGGAAAVGLTGCGGGDLGPMSGRHALDGRDFGDVFFWKTHTLAFTRDTADPSQPEPQDLFVWPLDEQQPTLALDGIDWEFPQRWPAWLAGDLLLTGYEYELIYDVANRQSVNLLKDLPAPPPDGGAPDGGSSSPSLEYLLSTTALRSDGRAFAKVMPAGDTIVVGRPSELRTLTIPDGGTVGGIGFIGPDLALLIKQPSGDGDVVGVQRMDTTSGALTQLVAPTPAAEWIGVAGFCAPGDSSRTCGFFGTVGCTIDEPACSDGRAPRCLVMYAKFVNPADPGGPRKTAGFVYDVGAGSVTKLDGDDPDTFVFDRANHNFLWGGTTANTTSWWNTCSDTSGHCDTWPGPIFAWRPDGGAAAMYGPGPTFMRTVNFVDGTCDAPDIQKTTSVFQAQYSPTSDRLGWVSANDAAETSFTLWLADADGKSAIAVATAPDLGGTFSRDGQHLYVSHNGASSAALGAVDVTASPPVEQILSANRGDIGLLGNRRVLFVDHFNVQDGNGELVLVDLATGARQSLARAVASVAVSGGSEDEGTDVAYAVRGRAPSSRDGLWLTTLPP